MYASAPGIFQCVFVPIIFLHVVISVPKFSECAQCECASVAAFFFWLFLRPKFQSVPNVNALLLPHFLACHFCAQIVSVHPM